MERKIIETNLKLLIGQDMAKELVTKSLEQGDCSTYLLVGPPQVGKGLLARIMAASWHSSADVERANLDTIIFDEILGTNSNEGEDNKWKKTVDDAVHLVNLSPQSGYRVLIIDDVDRLSVGAANALLKTLEEPPIHAKIIITAQSIGAVLPTIRSRAQIIRLSGVSDDDVRGYLKSRKVKQLDEVVVLANGSIGRANQLAVDADQLKRGIKQLDALKLVLQGKVVDGMSIANIKEREEALELVEIWTNLSHRLLLADLRDGRASWLGEEIKNLPDERWLTAWIARLREASEALTAGGNVRIVIEALVLAGTGAL